MLAITGAAGFIGSNLAHALAERGPLVLVDHPLTDPKTDNWNGLTNFTFVDQQDFLTQLGAGTLKPDVIFHLGACSSTTETDWDYLTRNNIEYTQTLWRWCVDHGCPFIYASSAATYGDGWRGFDDRIFPESLTPLNLYGKSKNEFDHWALTEIAANRPAPPRWAGLKFFNVYGPREAHKKSMASMVYHSHRQIHETGRVRLFKSNHPDYADGGQLRDFVYVGDCVRHMLWLWEQPHDGGLYNSGTGTPRSFRDLATAVFTALQRPVAIDYIDMPENLANQYQNFTKADISKLQATGYTLPPTTLEEGVRATVAWLEEQRAQGK